ncbi:MAG TPA: response regulator [Bacillales bacterium]|nr:response regulator [Bacillales bacterium]
MIRVAIAEDDFRVASIHEQFLSKVEDIEVVGKALDAGETIDLLSRHKVDLLLLDIYMPDHLGTDLLPDIRNRFPEVDLIMITASTDKHFLEASVRYGVLNYLIKPVSLERFKETIEEYKRKKEVFASLNEVDQSVIDHYFGHPAAAVTPKDDLPKGIDSLTLEKVKGIMADRDTGMTAAEMGEQMGASRTTARRYLEYLIASGEGRAELEYGIVGRPERKYYLFS